MTKLRVKKTECASDAIKRYLKRKGYQYEKWEKANAIRELFYKDGCEYIIDEMYYNMEKEMVEFSLMRTAS